MGKWWQTNLLTDPDLDTIVIPPNLHQIGHMWPKQFDRKEIRDWRLPLIGALNVTPKIMTELTVPRTRFIVGTAGPGGESSATK